MGGGTAMLPKALPPVGQAMDRGTSAVERAWVLGGVARRCGWVLTARATLNSASRSSWSRSTARTISKARILQAG